MRSLPILCTLSIACLPLLSCGGGGGGGGGGGVGEEDTLILPNAAGILMPGEPDAVAAEVLPQMLPSAALPDTLQEDGFMRTRLEALLALDATVAEVNAAIDAQGIRIVSMDPSSPVLTLVVPDSSPVDMVDRAQALVATGAFSAATLSYAAFDPTIGPLAKEELTSATPGETHGRPFGAMAGGVVPHPHEPIRLFGAQNAAALAAEYVGSGLLFFVPGQYGRSDTDPRITAMRMRSGYGIDSPFAKNDGFVDCALIARDYDGEGQIPVHPTAGDDLDIRAMQIAGLTWTERVREIASMLPPTRPSVMYTGLVYQPDFDARSRFWRAVDALQWRASLEHREFVHVTSAGETDFATPFNSPFAISKTYPDVADFLHPLDADTPQKTALLNSLSERIGERASEATSNVRVVGGTDFPSLEPLTTAAETADMLAVGVAVSPCFVLEGDCAPPGYQDVRGSRIAAAQVAGLASYIWSLDRSLSFQDVLDTLDYGWALGRNSIGVIDAYLAVLSLDRSLDDAPVRRAILDVTGPDARPDGLFDEHDLAKFLAVLNDPDGIDDPRFDLNGDSRTTVDAPAWMDLDADRLLDKIELGLERDVRQFVEMQVSDREALLYYAYSPLYTGDSQLRASYLAGQNGLGAAFITSIEEDTSHVVEAVSAVTNDIQTQMFEGFEREFQSQASTNLMEPEGRSDARAETEAVTYLGPAGNLVGYAASGSAFADREIVDPELGVAATGVCREKISFFTIGPVGCRLTVDYDGSATPDAEFAVHVVVTDEGATVFDQLVDVPAASMAGTITFEDVLPHNSTGMGYQVSLLVRARSSGLAATGQHSGVVHWEMAMSLTP